MSTTLMPVDSGSLLQSTAAAAAISLA